MSDLITTISRRPRLAPFMMNILPMPVFGATVAPDGQRYISNSEGILRAAPGSSDFNMLCHLDELDIERRPEQDHRLDHDPSGGIYFSVRAGKRLYRMPPDETQFHVVYDGLNGMLWGFDYHPATKLLLAGRYSPSGPAQLLSSRDGESWTILKEWNARHLHDVRVNPHNGWIYVVVGEGDPRITADSHAIYRSKDGAEFVRLFKRRRPFFVPVNFHNNLIIIGTDHPEGGNGIYAFEDDGSDGPFLPQLLFPVPESHQGLKHQHAYFRFLEWLDDSLFAGLSGGNLAFLLRTNNFADWEVIHSSRAPEMLMAYVSSSRLNLASQYAHRCLIVSGSPGLLISPDDGAELYGLPLGSHRAPRGSQTAVPNSLGSARCTPRPMPQAKQPPEPGPEATAEPQPRPGEDADARAALRRRLATARQQLVVAEAKLAIGQEVLERERAQAAEALAAAEARLKETLDRDRTQAAEAVAAAEARYQDALGRERAQAAEALAAAAARHEEALGREREQAVRALATAEEKRAAIEDDYSRQLAVLAEEKEAALAEAGELRDIASEVAQRRRETAAMRNVVAATEAALAAGEVLTADLIAERTRLHRLVKRQQATLVTLREERAETARVLAASEEAQVVMEQSFERERAAATKALDDAEKRRVLVDQSFDRRLAEAARALNEAEQRRAATEAIHDDRLAKSAKSLEEAARRHAASEQSFRRQLADIAKVLRQTEERRLRFRLRQAIELIRPAWRLTWLPKGKI